MKILCYVILFVLFSSSQEKNFIKSKLRNKNCENIKCPPVEDPVCVKIKNRKMKNDQYVIAVNKCEIKYALCQKDVEAVIVPMNHCHHNTVNQTKNRRYKRDTDNDDYKEVLKGEDTDVSNEVLKHDENNDDNVKEDTDVSNEVLKHDENNDENESQEHETNMKGKNLAVIIFKNKKTQDNEDSNASENENDFAEDKKDDDDDDDDNKLNDEASSHENRKEDSEMKHDYSDDEDKDDGNVLQGDESNTGEDEDREKMVTVDNVGKDYDQHEEQVDTEESHKDCPKVCPSRDVMVCAKCQHDIHKTFLSQCHLRMFSCQHPKEKLELVQRKPCMQSGPFMSKYEETKGRLPESGENDEVEKFIFCRENNLLNKDDPRCKFTKTT